MEKLGEAQDYHSEDIPTISGLDVDGLKVSDIDNLIIKLDKLRQEKKEKDLKEAWHKFEGAVLGLGMNIDEALDICKAKESKASRVLRIKYKDPENPKNVWAGRGKTPKWLREYEEQGRSKTEFRVK